MSLRGFIFKDLTNRWKHKEAQFADDVKEIYDENWEAGTKLSIMKQLFLHFFLS